MKKDGEHPTSGRSPREYRPSNSVPRWVTAFGIGSGLLVLAAIVSLYFPLIESGAMTCGRCGAVETGKSVLGIWLGSERPRTSEAWRPTPGQALVERVAGPCTSHSYQRTGCWYSLSCISCYRGGWSEPSFEVCAKAGEPLAERLAARLASRSEAERERLYDRGVSQSRYPHESEASARRWVAAVIDIAGWHDLETP